MGLENRAYIANDNGAPDQPSRDDRMGFNHFVRAAAKSGKARQSLGTAQSTPTHPVDSTAGDSQRNKTQPPAHGFGAALWPVLFLLAILGTAYLSLTAPNPASRLLALTGLFGLTMAAAGLSERSGAYRLKAVSLFTAIAAWVGGLLTLAQSFGLDVFNPAASQLYIITSIITLAAAWALKSRLALILSVAITALWGYAVYAGYISFNNAFIALPVIAGLQIFISQHLGDGFSRRLSQFILYGWSLCALMIAAMSGFTTPAFILSALTLLTGLIYLSSTHPFYVWARNKSRGIAVFTWFAFMSCCLATGWLWLAPADIDLSEAALSPMMDFIWQAGLIFGALALAAAALFRNPRLSHSLSRRLIGAVVIMALAASHYFKSVNQSGAAGQDWDAVYVIAMMALLGGLGIVTLSKLISAIRHGHSGYIFLSSLFALALFASFTSMSAVDLELLYISGIGALITIFGLALTHKKTARYTQSQNTYRPLKEASARHNEVQTPALERHDLSTQMQAS